MFELQSVAQRPLYWAVAALTITLAGCSPKAGNSNMGNSGQDKGVELATFDAVDAIEIVESPATGVALGWGWNRGDSEPVPTICVEFVPGEEPAQTRYMTMQEVSDNYTLMKSLGVSAEASVKAIGFEVSGKAAFAKSTNLSSTRSTFVMNAIVQNGVRYAAPVPAGEVKESSYQPAVNERGGSSGAIRLTPEALALARRKDNLQAFKHQCGSAFVSAIYGGAKLTTAISFASSSRSDKEKLSAELSGGGWGARFKSKVDKAQTSGSSSERMDVSIFMTGGKGDAIPASKEDLLAKLETISLDAYVAPKDFQIAITPYEVLSNWPGELLPDKETEFDELASYWGAYNTLYDEMQQILDHPQDYYLVQTDEKGCPVIPQCVAQRQALASSEDTLKQLQKNLVSIAGWNDILNKIKKPLVQARDVAKSALVKCEAGFNLASARQASMSLDSLKRAQDEVLEALRQLQDDARKCSDKSDACSFEAKNYRSPYAFRIQLPVPIDAGLQTADEITDYYVGRPAKQRCEFSATDPGCLSNAQIGQWRAKLGYIPVNRKVRPEVFIRYADKAKALQQQSDDLTAEGCNARPFVLEEGYNDVLWYNLKHAEKKEQKPQPQADQPAAG